MRYWAPLALASAARSRNVSSFTRGKGRPGSSLQGPLPPLRQSKQQLDLPGDPFDVPEQFLLEMFVGLRVDTADDLQHHADHMVDDLHRALVNKAGQEGIADRGGMARISPARSLWRAVEGLEDFHGTAASASGGTLSARKVWSLAISCCRCFIPGAAGSAFS